MGTIDWTVWAKIAGGFLVGPFAVIRGWQFLRDFIG
jgi:hypothetical protein